MNALKQKIAAGRPVYGCWIFAAWPESAEIAAALGYDFVVFDLEHGQGDARDAMHAMRALKGSGTECVVRIPDCSHVYIKRYLDAGARSLMVPMVSTPDEARQIADHAYYPPRGQRGYAAMAVRASLYGMNPDYVAEIDDDLLLIAQIETAEGVLNAEAIANTDGIDMIFVGPADLTGAYGVPLDQINPSYVEAVAHIESCARSAGKSLGSFPTAARDSAALRAAGYALMAGPCDVVLLREGLKAALDQMRR
jgi:4-hydroxy-2-oxoheptanedioate aldolase